MFKINSSIAVCQLKINFLTNVSNYFSKAHARPVLVDPTDPSIGIRNEMAYFDNKRLVCSFSRNKNIPGNLQYFDISYNNKYFIIFASWSIVDDGILLLFKYCLKL